VAVAVLAVVRGGKVIAETAENISKLQIDGRPKTVNGADYAPKNLG
jgi:cytosine deaminase